MPIKKDKFYRWVKEVYPEVVQEFEAIESLKASVDKEKGWDYVCDLKDESYDEYIERVHPEIVKQYYAMKDLEEACREPIRIADGTITFSKIKEGICR